MDARAERAAIFRQLDAAIARARPEDRPGLIVELSARLGALGAVLATPASSEGETAGERLYTAREAAGRLGIPESMVYTLMNRGDLRHHRVGRKYKRVPASAIDEYLKRAGG